MIDVYGFWVQVCIVQSCYLGCVIFLVSTIVIALARDTNCCSTSRHRRHRITVTIITTTTTIIIIIKLTWSWTAS